MRTMPREMSEVDRVGDAPPPAASWRTLDRAAGVAALITAVLVPIQLAVFVAYPFPDTVTGWFELLQDNPLAGLVMLRDGRFGRAIPCTLIAGNLIGCSLYPPRTASTRLRERRPRSYRDLRPCGGPHRPP